MHRQVVQTAIGRRGRSLAVDTCRTALAATTRSSLSLSHPSCFFSTSAAEEGGSRNTGGVVITRVPSTGRERSRQAASQLGRLQPSNRPPRPAHSGVVDARALGGTLRRTPVDASNVVSLRSLRGRGGRFGGAASDGSNRAPGGRERDNWSGLGRFAGSRFGARGGRGGRGGRDGPGGRDGRDGRGGSGTSAGNGWRREKGEKRGEGKGDDKEKMGGKLEWSAEEQGVINRMEQGVVTEYTPQLTAEGLSGYGPAVATHNTLGKIESALESMRILGGAAAFNRDAGVTADTREMVTRYYHEKKPVFFNSAEEKAWLQGSTKKGIIFRAPQQSTKQAIIDTAILGKYDTPDFADVKDTMATMSNYHARTTSYKPSDAEKFMNKVRELLPTDTTAKAVSP